MSEIIAVSREPDMRMARIGVYEATAKPVYERVVEMQQTVQLLAEQEQGKVMQMAQNQDQNHDQDQR